VRQAWDDNARQPRHGTPPGSMGFGGRRIAAISYSVTVIQTLMEPRFAIVDFPPPRCATRMRWLASLEMDHWTMTKVTLKYVGLFILISALSGAILFFNLVNPVLEFARRNEIVDGVLTGRQCENHEYVRYSYAVGRMNYRASANAFDNCARMPENSVMPVWVSKSNPSNSSLHDPAMDVETTAKLAIFGSLGLGLFISISFYLGLEGRRA
jgi:hypothetical protein